MKPDDVFEPMWASPPGQTVSELQARKGVTTDELAAVAGVSVDLVEDVIRGVAKVTRPLAVALSDSLGGSVQFWIVREQQYREDLTRRRLLVEASNIEWTAELPVSELINLRWMPAVDASERLDAVLNYFGVRSISEWRTTYGPLVSAVSFRTSPIFNSHLGSVLAWLRQGELQASKIELKKWSSVRLRESLSAMRALTRWKSTRQFMPKLQALCADSGVALVVAQAPRGCKASGATWVSRGPNPICLLSHRYKTDDQFWFTFFHEIGHLLLHSDRSIFLENGGESAGDEEAEADKFAQDMLIPVEERSRLSDVPRTYRGVIRVAAEIGVSPGIVVGQMQHEGLLPPNWLNAAKRKLNW